MHKLRVFSRALRDPILRFGVRKHLELARSSTRCFSQFGEDLVVAKVFDWAGVDLERSCFVDIGAFHPSWISNTYLHYRNGLTGINVDVSEEKIRLFEAFRPRDVSLLGAVVPDDGPDEVTIASPGGFSDVASVLEGNPDPVARDPHFSRGGLRHLRVRAIRVSELLDRVPQGKELVYLNVDCEGLDESIVRSIDFDRVRPLTLSMEAHHPPPHRLERLRDSPVHRFLTDRDYTFLAQCALTSIYLDARSLETGPKLWI